MSADCSWLKEQPEPILSEALATEAVIARREAADEPHPLDCTCHEHRDYDDEDRHRAYDDSFPEPEGADRW